MAKSKFVLLESGNSGNKAKNRDLASQFFASFFEQSEQIDKRTLSLPDWGLCHVAAYTSSVGAMISDTHEGGKYIEEFGQRDHWLMFREVGDGRCFLFICDPKDLIGQQDIGKGGISWSKLNTLAKYRKALKVSDVLKYLQTEN